MDPARMGGTPCIRGTRVTVATIVGPVAEAHSTEVILEVYLDRADLRAVLRYAA